MEREISINESEILKALKENGPMTMAELGEKFSTSKVTILKKLKSLEQKELVERRIRKTDMGRPTFVFRSITGSNIPMNNNAALNLLVNLGEFLHEKGRDRDMEEFLEDRYEKTYELYLEEMKKSNRNSKLEQLASVREKELYEPELSTFPSGDKVLVEYNCPIFQIAKRYPIACHLEKIMFSRLTDMKVENEHRQVNGYSCCKFMFKLNNKK